MEGHFSYLSYPLTPSVLWIGHYGRDNCYQDKHAPSYDKDDHTEQFYTELVQLKILRVVESCSKICWKNNPAAKQSNKSPHCIKGCDYTFGLSALCKFFFLSFFVFTH